MTTLRNGDRVIVSHDLGDEAGTVIGATCGEDYRTVTVRFDDGTVSTWGIARVRPVTTDGEETREDKDV